MDRREFLAAAGAATLAGPLAAQLGVRQEDDFADLAEKVAKQAAPLLAQKLSAQGKVAVFPPGDADGKFTVQMEESARVLQGELIYHLINLAQGKFFVLDKAALAQAFTRGGVAPGHLDRTNPARTAGVLKQLGVDAAVLGSIDAKKSDPEAVKPVRTSLAVQFQDGQVRQLTGQVGPGALIGPQSNVSERLRLELWLMPEGQRPRRLPIVTDRREGSEHAGLLYAVLPRGLALGTPAAQYGIRLRNTGVGMGGMFTNEPAREYARLFTAAVAVDGVNSIYQDRGDGNVGPVMVHPRHARRWVLTGPGQVVRADPAQPGGFRLERTSGGAGGASVDVIGFQRDNQTALSFTFVKAGESIAEAAGVTGDIGVLSAVIYPQKLPGDRPIQATVMGGGIGTGAGAPKRNVTVRIKVDTYPAPTAEYRVYYRPEGEVPIPVAERVDPWAQFGQG